jgi:hypothetical protein
MWCAFSECSLLLLVSSCPGGKPYFTPQNSHPRAPLPGQVRLRERVLERVPTMVPTLHVRLDAQSIPTQHPHPAHPPNPDACAYCHAYCMPKHVAHVFLELSQAHHPDARTPDWSVDDLDPQSAQRLEPAITSRPNESSFHPLPSLGAVQTRIEPSGAHAIDGTPLCAFSIFSIRTVPSPAPEGGNDSSFRPLPSLGVVQTRIEPSGARTIDGTPFCSFSIFSIRTTLPSSSSSGVECAAHSALCSLPSSLETVSSLFSNT